MTTTDSRKSAAFHSYSDEELRREYGEPAQHITGVDGYFVLARGWAYMGPCGSEGAGVFVFENKLHALRVLPGIQDDLPEENMDASSFQEWKGAIEVAIESIERERRDDGIGVSVVGYDTGNSGFLVLAEGYWADFVPAAIDVIVSDLREYLSDDEEDDDEDEEAEEGQDSGEAEENEDEENEDDEEEDDEIAILRELRAREDIFSEEFVSLFAEACEEFSMRHC